VYALKAMLVVLRRESPCATLAKVRDAAVVCATHAFQKEVIHSPVNIKRDFATMLAIKHHPFVEYVREQYPAFMKRSLIKTDMGVMCKRILADVRNARQAAAQCEVVTTTKQTNAVDTQKK